MDHIHAIQDQNGVISDQDDVIRDQDVVIRDYFDLIADQVDSIIYRIDASHEGAKAKGRGLLGVANSSLATRRVIFGINSLATPKGLAPWLAHNREIPFSCLSWTSSAQGALR